MDRIKEHKRVEDDQVQGKGKAKFFTPEWGDFRPDHFSPSRQRWEFFSQTPQYNARVVDSIFKEPTYQVLEKIKNKK